MQSLSTITVVAQVVAKSDAVETVKTELLKMVAPTRLEEGCLEYRLHQDRQDPAVFVFYENWASLEALERHVKSPHYQAYVAAVGDKLAEKQVRKMIELAA